MIIITDILRTPFDEGAKVAIFYLMRSLKQQFECNIFSVNGLGIFDFVDFYLKTNKLLFDLTFYRELKDYNYDKLLYIPEASITLASFFRARFLQIFTGKKVTIFSLQPRKYNLLVKIMIKFIRPECIITQTDVTAKYLENLGINCKVVPLGVDDTKYNEFDTTKKMILREKYSIEPDKTILLHVGHIKSSRNLDWFIQIKEKFPETEIIIIGSSYNLLDDQLCKKLDDTGIIIKKNYISEIEEFYNLADYYIFPVIQKDGAIETPLSVLEAMACNIPVITTRFGSLPDHFKEDVCFRFVDSCEEIYKILLKKNECRCNNREKVKPFSWNEIS